MKKERIVSTEELQAKYVRLLDELRALGSVAVAFSGGVNPTFPLHAAKEALGEKVLAVTASSCTFPERELREAEAANVHFYKNL